MEAIIRFCQNVSAHLTCSVLKLTIKNFIIDKPEPHTHILQLGEFPTDYKHVVIYISNITWEEETYIESSESETESDSKSESESETETDAEIGEKYTEKANTPMATSSLKKITNKILELLGKQPHEPYAEEPQTYIATSSSQESTNAL